MKAFLHIGTEKTGTTSIQRFIVENEENLKLHNFSIVKCCGVGNSRLLPAICMRGERYDEVHNLHKIFSIEDKINFNKKIEKMLREELETLSAAKNNIIISSEHFHSRCIHRDEICKLKEIISDYYQDIEVIIYLRPQVDVATSLYTTILRSGGSPKFLDFVQNNLKADNYYYNYDQIVENWSSVFEAENINIRLFQRDAMVNQDLIADFLYTLDLEYSEKYIFSETMNESLNPLYQETVRLANKLNLSYKESLMQFLESNGVGKGQYLNSTERSSFQSKFDDSNSKVALSYFGKEKLFDEAAEKEFPECVVSNESSLLISYLLNNSKKELSYGDVDTIRDAAISLEKNNINLAFSLMSLAARLRPDGPFIRKKLEQYNEKILAIKK